VTRPLFVYGTLLPALAKPRQAALTARLPRLGPATVAGRLYDLGPYPGLVLDPTAGPVHGELFALPDDPAVLVALDEYEGYDPAAPAASLFRRVACEATAANGQQVEGWVYVYAGDVSRAARIDAGDYRRWCILRSDRLPRS
jgi:gamma-glutamylcyclotransferase (GGCT)/AIG2-like uncharacterized protein YtfP